VDVGSIISSLGALVPDADYQASDAPDRPTVVVPAARLLATATAARSLGFDVLTDVVGVDFWPAEPRFQVLYHLVATAVPAQLRLLVRLPGEHAEVSSVHAVWPAADWLEREVWDLFGIVFLDHGDLRRLLMPEDWDGHPLRKDYPVQIKMTPKVYEPLQLSEKEFQSNIVADRDVRGGSRRPGRSSR
jgi:NADH-quinone oxidoreductase subunit C